MSQELARQLLSAGGTTDADGKINYILVVDAKSSLICQHWNGETIAKQEVLVKSVRPNSTAAYIINDDEKIVVFVTPSSKLGASTYDAEERIWTQADSDEIPITNHAVHPKGKVTSSPDASGKVFVFFQDANQRLVCLNDEWTATTLPGDNPIAGTPIVVFATLEGDFVVHYISSTDKFIHALVRGKDDVWKDVVAFKYACSEDVKALCLGEGEFYALTEDGKVFKFDVDGKKTDLGTVQDGKFFPKTVEQARIRETYYRNGKLKSRTIEGGYIRGYDYWRYN